MAWDKPPKGDWKNDNDSFCVSCRFAHWVQSGTERAVWLECSNPVMIQTHKPHIPEDRRIGITVTCSTVWPSCNGINYERRNPEIPDYEKHPLKPMFWKE